MSKDSYTVGREECCDVTLTAEMFTHGTFIGTVSKVHFRVVRVCIIFALIAIPGYSKQHQASVHRRFKYKRNIY